VNGEFFFGWQVSRTQFIRNCPQACTSVVHFLLAMQCCSAMRCLSWLLCETALSCSRAAQTSPCLAMKLSLSSLTALLWSPRSCSAQLCLHHSWLRHSSLLPCLTPSLCQDGPLQASLMLQGSHKGIGMPRLSEHSPVPSDSHKINLHHPREPFIPRSPLEIVL